MSAERERAERERREIRRELTPLEKRIEGLESRQAAIDAALSDPGVLADSGRVQSLMVERSATTRELSEAYDQWESLSLRLESIAISG